MYLEFDLESDSNEVNCFEPCFELEEILDVTGVAVPTPPLEKLTTIRKRNSNLINQST